MAAAATPAGDADLGPEVDNISLTSTIEEDFNSEEEWPVNQILAEGYINGEIQYLSEWAGLPLSSASWEPREHFQEGLLKDWENTKEKQRTGENPRFYISEWRKAVIDNCTAKFKRHAARNRKRKAMGKNTTVLDQTLDDIVATMDALPTDNIQSNTERLQLDKFEEHGQSPTTRTQEESQPRRRKLHVPPNLQRRHTSQLESSEPTAEDAALIQDLPRAATANSTPVARKHSLHETSTGKGKGKGSLYRQTPATASSQTTNVFAGGQKSNSSRNLLSAASNPNQEPKMLKARFQWLIAKGQRDKEGTIAPSRMPNSLISLDPRNPGVLRRDQSGNLTPAPRKQTEDGSGSDAMDIDSLDSDSGLVDSVPPQSDTAVPSDGAGLQTQSGVTKVSDPKPGKKKVASWLNQDDATGVRARDLDEPGLFITDENSRDAEPSEVMGVTLEDSVAATPQLSSLSLKASCDKWSESKLCRIGSQALESLTLQFEGMLAGEKPLEICTFLTDHELLFTHTCTAHDYLQQLQVGELAEATIAVGSISAAPKSERVDNLVETLRISCAGLLCHTSQYCVLIYPARAEEWQIDDTVELADSAGNCLLRYSIFKPNGRFKSSNLQCHRPAASEKFTYPPAIGLFDPSAYAALLPLHQPVTTAQQAIRDSFCLVFPPSAQHEADLLLQWLQISNADSDLRCSLVPGHWLSFVKRGHGVIILHEDVLDSVYRIPSIATLLHSKGDIHSFWVFRRPLRRTLDPSAISSPKLNRSGLLLDRIFRPGIAILVTPSFIVSQPKQAYNFFKWFWQNFSSNAQIYRQGKLVMCAEAGGWLLELATQCAREPNSNEGASSIEARFKSAALIKSVLSESEGTPNCPIVCAPVHVDSHDEQSLVNWFAWWSLTQTANLRKFSFVCSDSSSKDLLTRKIRPPLFDERSTKTQTEIRAESSKPLELLKDDTVASFVRYIEELEHRVLPAASNWKPLVLYRQPVAEMDNSFEARSFTYFGSWVQFYLHRCLPRVMRTNKLGGGVRTTYLGFFYTKVATGGVQRTHCPGSRDPWLAILRPINLNRRPLTGLELLIWDVGLKEKIKSSVDMACSDLIPAQQALIEQVTALTGRNDDLPLDRVWVGGFKSSHRLSHPVDKTLDFLEALLCSYKDWLPFDQDALEGRGWKYVARTRLASSYGLANESALAQHEAVKMVFDPPTLTTDSSAPRIKNRLCQWAIDNPGGKEAAFTFVPTMEWYKEQLEAGCGYEHIKGTSWKAVFEQYRILDPDKLPEETS